MKGQIKRSDIIDVRKEKTYKTVAKIAPYVFKFLRLFVGEEIASQLYMKTLIFFLLRNVK
ncbi:hypothetical protein [Flavobacterium crassostreae]|uniref:Uncharacterized protein n=1 Tax=Flavobacterium crassostreae TaxID=1763534 RepID=A0A1B9E7M9_9FLAO|nr:hypothetical protein [Flavobacterium crassostreae]OCB77952.1 hypothetical protein LPBF_03120 [Flavobacterium crassostreae]